MKREHELKVQAWLDGELSGTEACEVEQLIANDAALSAIAGELRMAKGILAGNEPEVATLTDSREFYFSKIAREIERLDRQPATAARSFWSLWWVRVLVPAGAAAVMVALIALPDRPGTSADETENSVQESTIIQFHSTTEKMDVIWIHSDVDGTPDVTSPDLAPKADRNDNN